MLLYSQDNPSRVFYHALVSRAWWTSSTGQVAFARAAPRQWSTWPEGHTRGMAPVVATSKGQSRPPGRRLLINGPPILTMGVMRRFDQFSMLCRCCINYYSTLNQCLSSTLYQCCLDVEFFIEISLKVANRFTLLRH